MIRFLSSSTGVQHHAGLLNLLRSFQMRRQMSSINCGDLISFRWPKDDNRTWIEYIGLATAEGKFIYGNRHIEVIRYDGIWLVPCSWCIKVSDIQMCG